MKLLANENFPLDTSILLRQAGYDVLCIGEDFAGVMDDEVMNLAIEQDRIILTFDRDYGELIFKHGYMPPRGVIYFRLGITTETDLFEILIDLLTNPTLSFDHCLTVSTGKGRFKQRNY